MVAVCRNARRLAEVVDLPLPQAYERMRAIPGLGPRTVNGAGRDAPGDPDALAAGRYCTRPTVGARSPGRARGHVAESAGLCVRGAGPTGGVRRAGRRGRG